MRKKQKRKFSWFKMWSYYLLASFMKDYGKIPDDIGDRILVSNNLFITRRYMSSMITIYEYGEATPKNLMAELVKAIRDKGNTSILDFGIRTSKFRYDPKDSGLDARMATWEAGLDDSVQITQQIKKRYARLLYTAQEAKNGTQLYECNVYLVIRNKDIKELVQAEKIVMSKLYSYGCVFNQCTSMLKQDLMNYLISSRVPIPKKSVKTCMMSKDTISESLPCTGAPNDSKGCYLGVNIENSTNYYIDFDTIKGARNIYALAPAGGGKTALAMSMLQSAYENGSDCIVVDIKGNEYTEFCRVTNGITISLRQSSIEYINSWIMHKEDLISIDKKESYFNARFALSIQQFVILSGLTDVEDKRIFEALITRFHTTFYNSLGVIADNPNSWKATEDLTPFKVYKEFKDWAFNYNGEGKNVLKSAIITLEQYFIRDNAKAYIFTKDFNYTEIYRHNVIVFDFGMLQESSNIERDDNIYRLKLLYMTKLNGVKVTASYSAGKRTFKILEESQIVSDDVMQIYAQEITLRRSQNQDTLLLGNSLKALEGNTQYSRSIIENIRCLLLGELTSDARKKVMDIFDIHELEPMLLKPGSDLKYKYSFALINKMQDKRLYPIIKVVNPNSSIITPTKEDVV